MRARHATGAVPALIGGLVLAFPDLAQACAVCFGGGDANWTPAFYAGTLLMLALPPAIVVIAAIAIYRATRRQEARRAALRLETSAAHPAGGGSSRRWGA